MRIKLLYTPILLMFIGSNLAAQVKPMQPGKSDRLITYKDRIKNEPKIAEYAYDDKRGTPGFIRFNENVSFPVNESEQLLSKFLPVRKNLDALTKVGEDAVYGNMEVLRYQQYFKGIKVEHGSYVITAKDNKVSFMSGEYYEIDPEQKTTPGISAEIAFSRALQYVNASLYIWQTPDSVLPYGKKSTADLVFVDNAAHAKGQRLAYKFDIYAVRPLSRANIYVDAENGEIILSDAIIKHTALGKPSTAIVQRENGFNNAKSTDQRPDLLPNITASAVTRYTGTRSIITDQVTASLYRLRETDRTSGANNRGSLVETYNCKTSQWYAAAVDFTDADNNWAEYNNAAKDNAALDAHWGAEKVLEYWWNVHGRKSIDNKGFGIKSFIHYDVAYDNAYWNGVAMTYGDGTGPVGTGFDALTSLDVCGHEIGHGLCEFTANLVYMNESGAMNEGFSDIWGASIENYTIGIGDVEPATNKEPFKIGEEIVASAAQPLRSMIDPHSTTTFGTQPDTYLEPTYWYTGAADNGGVHTNSGVLNHWFYILVQGESGTNGIGNVYSVTGIGWTKAERIAYVTELNLSANADYAACRVAAINAVTALYGRCSTEYIAVVNSWYAVGVGAVYGACTSTSTVQFAINTDKAYEGSGKADCTYPSGAPASHTINAVVTLSNVSSVSQNTDVTVSTTGSTAIAGIDFTISPSTLTWAPNTSGPKNFVITILDDNNNEADETINLSFTINNHGGTAAAGVNTTEIITISDNDTLASTYSNDAIIGDFAATTTGAQALFRGGTPRKRIQYLYPATEMHIAGLKPGNISHLFLYIMGTATVTTFTNLNIVLGTTAATDLSGAFASFVSSSTVYSNNYSTPTAEGFYDFPLATPIYWDGLSNILIQACYDNTSGGTNYGMAVSITGTTLNTRYVSSGSTGASLCATTAGASTSTIRPDIALGMYSPIQSVVNLSRTAYLGPNTDVSFYSASDGKLMARIVNGTSFDYGCTQVAVDRAGTGGSTFWRNGAAFLVTNKTFRVLTTTDNPSGIYNITLYYTKAEHDGWEAATGKDWEALSKIVKIKGHDISEVTTSSTGLFSSVDIPATATRSAFLIDYQITASFGSGFSGFAVGDPGLAPVPVKLISFTGIKNKGTSLLNWVTANESNNDRFEIEVSNDGASYRKIGTVASNGNSINNQYYGFTDLLPANGANYYRLKQVDKDGRFTYSNIVTLEFDFDQFIRINPNPATDVITVIVGRPAAGTSLRIYAFDGKLVRTENMQTISRSYQIDVADLRPGIYMLEADINGQKLTQRFIKQ